MDEHTPTSAASQSLSHLARAFSLLDPGADRYDSRNIRLQSTAESARIFAATPLLVFRYAGELHDRYCEDTFGTPSSYSHATEQAWSKPIAVLLPLCVRVPAP